LPAWIVLSLFWWGGGLWTGPSLVAIAQTRGMAACVARDLVGEALLIPERIRVPGAGRLCPAEIGG
jgi:hypothetical protein